LSIPEAEKVILIVKDFTPIQNPKSKNQNRFGCNLTCLTLAINRIADLKVSRVSNLGAIIFKGDSLRRYDARRLVNVFASLTLRER